MRAKAREPCNWTAVKPEATITESKRVAVIKKPGIGSLKRTFRELLAGVDVP